MMGPRGRPSGIYEMAEPTIEHSTFAVNYLSWIGRSIIGSTNRAGETYALDPQMKQLHC
jgi:hypothetical protein